MSAQRRMDVLEARAIKMNVLSQGDKHVNKTCGARGGEEMGRAHPHSRLHPRRRRAPRRASGGSHTPPRRPPSSSQTVSPRPLGISGLPVGILTGTFVCFVFRER